MSWQTMFAMAHFATAYILKVMSMSLNADFIGQEKKVNSMQKNISIARNEGKRTRVICNILCDPRCDF